MPTQYSLTPTKKETKKKKKTNEQILAKLSSFWEEASEDRKQYDWKWFMYGLWVRGYHYARYDKNKRMIVGNPTDDGRPKVTINKIYPALRGVRNYALRNQPKAQVSPENHTDTSLEQALKSTKFLDYIHETKKLRAKLKGSVFQALEDSVAWWQVIFNQDIEVNQVDVFDFYPDPKARNTKEMRYGIMAVSRRIVDLLEDDKYIKEEVQQIKADNKASSSSYKDMLLSYDRKGSGIVGEKESKQGTVIVKEYWYKEDGKIYVCAEAGGRLIRKPEEVDTPIIPFFKLASDIMPFSMYGEGWVKNMIDPQKLLNSATSSVAEYNLIMNKVRVVADKGAGVRTFNNKHGQILEKKKGYDVTTQNSAPINNSIFEQIRLAEKWIEDIGAMHDASFGRVPTGAKSGRAIETLQVGDSNNMSELVENIEDFLEDVYEYILWLASKKYQDMREIVVMDYTGQQEFLKVIGEDSEVAQTMMNSPEGVPEDVLVIPSKNIVDVKIGSFLAYTPEAKRESVKELMGLLPDLPEDVVLDAYGVGNIAEVIKGIKEKRAEARQEELAQQQASMVQEQAVNNPQAGAQEAIASIRTMIEGGSPQVPQNAGPQFIEAIDQFLAREGQMGELEPEVLQAIQTFRDQVVQGVGR